MFRRVCLATFLVTGYLSINYTTVYFTGFWQEARRFSFVARQNPRKGQYIEVLTKRWGS
jgi:hypothetical protein